MQYAYVLTFSDLNFEESAPGIIGEF